MDEDDNVVCVLLCPSTKLSLIHPTLKQLLDEGFEPVIVCIDNAPTSENKMQTEMMSIFTSAMPTIEFVIQGLFHAVAGFTKCFPNQSESWFHDNVTLPVRRAMRQMDSTRLAELRLLLQQGNVSITSSYRGDTVIIGADGLEPSQIDDLIASGHFYKMFCSGHRNVIPMIFHSKSVMKKHLWGVHKDLQSQLYQEDGESKLIDNTFMVGALSKDAFRKEFANFVARAVGCIPPVDDRVQYFSLIPRPGKMPLVKYKLMTGTNESLHSRVGAVGGATNSLREYKHAHATISIVEMMRKKESKEGACAAGHLDFQLNSTRT
jgi:hypothetical protein